MSWLLYNDGDFEGEFDTIQRAFMWLVLQVQKDRHDDVSRLPIKSQPSGVEINSEPPGHVGGYINSNTGENTGALGENGEFGIVGGLPGQFSETRNTYYPVDLDSPIEYFYELPEESTTLDTVILYRRRDSYYYVKYSGEERTALESLDLLIQMKSDGNAILSDTLSQDPEFVFSDVLTLAIGQGQYALVLVDLHEGIMDISYFDNYYAAEYEAEESRPLNHDNKYFVILNISRRNIQSVIKA
jgi:hypothetical protein